MTQCRECFAELSPGAKHCPKCGRELGTPFTIPPAVPKQSWRIVIIGVGIAGIFALLAIIGIVFDPLSSTSVVPPTDLGNIAAVPSSPAPPLELVATTAEELGKVYDENELTARDRFEGRPIRVTGTVQRIGSNQGEPTLLLQGSRAMQAAFADPVPLKTLKGGEQVTFTCEALNAVEAGLAFRNCVLNTQGDRAAPVERRTGPQ